MLKMDVNGDLKILISNITYIVIFIFFRNGQVRIELILYLFYILVKPFLSIFCCNTNILITTIEK